MKRIRHIYVAEGYPRISSDDPRLRNSGLLGAAMLFGNYAAKREYGPNGQCLGGEPGEYHRMRPGQKKHLPLRAKLDVSGYTDYHIIIGVSMGCGLMEFQEITIPIRITRGRGHNEYYEES